MAEQGEAQTVDAFKSNVEDMALEELSRLRARRDSVASELTAIDGSIKSVRKILGTLNPQASKKRAPRAGKTQTISANVREKFLEWVKGHDGDITSKMIAEGLGISSTLATTTAKQMREEGYLRLSATSGPTNIYRSEV